MSTAQGYSSLRNEQDSQQGRPTLPIVLKYVTLVSILCLHEAAHDMQSYASSEWIRNKIKLEMFPNSSVRRLPECADVNHSRPEFQRNEHVQQEASRWHLYQILASCVPSFFTTLVYPSLTDAYGRRFLVIISIVGSFLQEAVTALVICFDGRFEFLIAGSFLTGLGGSTHCLQSVAHSYITDISPPQKRTSLFAFQNAAVHTSSAIISLVIGYFIQSLGFVYPAFTSCGVSGLALIVAICVLSESLEPARRVRVPSLLTFLYRPFQFYSSQQFQGKKKFYILLMLTTIFLDLGKMHEKSLQTLYQMGYPFCWKASKIAIFASVREGARVFTGIVFGIISAKAWFPDISAAILGSSLHACSFVIEAFAKAGWLLFVAIVPAQLILVIGPVISSQLSGITPESHQGALFSGISFAQNICSLLAGLINNSVYAATISIMNGFVFLILAGLSLVIALLLGLYAWQNYHRPTDLSTEDISEDAETT